MSESRRTISNASFAAPALLTVAVGWLLEGDLPGVSRHAEVSAVVLPTEAASRIAKTPRRTA